MRVYKLLAGVLLLILMQSCTTMQLTNQGEKAFQSGDYTAALEAWEQVINGYESQAQSAEGEIYFKAGMAAYELDQTDKAQKYLEVARFQKYPSPKVYTTLATIYRDIDNLSKEITALQEYRENFPQGEEIEPLTRRLFETYVESENWQWAVDLWPQLSVGAKEDLSFMTGYLQASRKVENNQVCNDLATKILKLDAKNTQALEWFALKYYHLAEDTYVTEMRAYKHNRTTKQYNRLLKKLKQVYPNFRRSRDYFLQLYKQDPKAEYAQYLAIIYNRLDQKKKAAYYQRKAK